MATAVPPFNLFQFHQGLLDTYPARVTPPGWGLSSSGNTILDPSATFTDAEIQGVVDATVYDPDFGVDADRLSLRDQALGVLDDIIANVQSLNLQNQAGRDNLLLAVKRLAQIQRRVIRLQNLVDPSTLPTPD